MAVPNITNTDDIEIKVAHTSGINVVSSIETLVTVASDDVVKVDSIIVANTDASNDYQITLAIDADAGGTLYYIAKAVNVPAATTLRIEGPIHLEETDLLKGYADTNAKLDVIVSYVAISD